MHSNELRTTRNQPPRSEQELTSRWGGTGATPLGLKDSELLLQNGVSKSLMEGVLFQASELGVSDRVMAYVEMILLSREARHLAKGKIGWSTRLEECIEGESYMDAVEMERVTDKAHRGIATPLELLQLRHDAGMGSVELARVTGRRDTLINLMDQEVCQAVKTLNGQMLDSQPRTTLRAFDIHGQTPEAILVTRRLPFAVCEGDTRVMRRESYVLPLALLDDTLRSQILSVPRERGPDEWRRAAENALLNLGDDLRDYLNDSHSSIMISSTYYAVNAQTQQAQKSRDKAAREEARRIFCERYPALSAATSGYSANSAD